MIRPPADPVKTDSAPGIIYILGSGHSGSTLLSLLLTSHSQVTGVGELKALSPSAKWSSQERAEGPCTCGAPTLRHCAFWRRLDAAVTELAGCSVWEVDLDSEDPAVFATHNLAVFRAIATITGRHWIVDSSKNVGRLEKLIAARLVDVRPVRLIRSASGVVYSNVKRGRPWLPRARAYIRCPRSRESAEIWTGLTRLSSVVGLSASARRRGVGSCPLRWRQSRRGA